MITLALDASTYVGDVAVIDGSDVLAELSIAMNNAEHERLMPAIVDALQSASVEIDEVRRVVCGAGPGSFTSLRIAGAIAKGIASGVGVPLFAVSSMALIVGAAAPSAGRYLTVVDALRGEAYVALYQVQSDRALVELQPPRLVLVGEVEALASEHDARTIGPSRELCSIVARPRAKAAATLETAIVARGPVDLSAWEPAYGRLAEAQVKWESAHGRPLPAG